MKAVRIHAYGDRSVLRYEDAPLPECGDDDVLIRVIAAAVNPVDWKIREGYLKEMLPYKLPLTPGWDVAGIVERVGSKVSGVAVGDRVYSRPDISRQGSYAEYIAVRASEVAAMPRTLGYAAAASLPLAGITAWESLIDKGNLQAGQSVLIHAAAGGVGSLAVQLAKWRGAHVIATASAANVALVQSLGADEVIDYRTMPFAEHVRDVDLVFDTVGGDVQEQSWSVLKAGGTLVSIVAPPDAARAAAAGVQGKFVFIQPSATILRELATLADAGQLRPLIGAEFGLERIAEAHALSESGRTVGKIVLHIGKP
ncbi:NADP-dependent oxidoreductase [Chitinilyticum litopenaei]|uniref:NADP-dependent oxidoreductase n=1 Tax=Chitinilyticum litopenaei TaxID=1121276 RepID=UPI00041808DA|nr:NADP-dependent oxidoreductase [Chitinilyticum litopenaei]